MIRNNAKEFCAVASQPEVLALLDSIKSGSEKITFTFLQEIISSLSSNIDITKAKVQSVKTESVIG